MEVSSHVSAVAAIVPVRHKLVQLQQEFGREKGIVMDGRDIGTTVFPDAELKIYVNASAETRARRRYDELRAKGQDVSYDEVLANVRERDHIDSTRAESPLRRADDAIDLDNFLDDWFLFLLLIQIFIFGDLSDFFLLTLIFFLTFESFFLFWR